MKILILGAGGVGGYFGAALIRVGADVTFLLRPQRKALLDTQGLCVETPTDRYTVAAPSLTAEDLDRTAFDLVILAPKAYDLDSALSALHQLRGPAVLLPLLNGWAHLEPLDQQFGRQRVMGGVAHIHATLTPTGAVKRLSALHSLKFGHRDPAHRAMAHDFEALCATAAFDGQRSDHIEQVLWDKWVFLATLAGMTTLCHTAVGPITATPHGAAVTRAMYQECCDIAHAHGYPIDTANQAKALAQLTERGSALNASMLRDLQAGLRTEHEHVLGSLIRHAQAQGQDPHLLMLAHTHLCAR